MPYSHHQEPNLVYFTVLEKNKTSYNKLGVIKPESEIQDNDTN